MQDFFFSNGAFSHHLQDAEVSSDALEGADLKGEFCWVFPTKEVLETIWHPKLSIVVP